MTPEKLAFLQKEATPLLRNLDPSAQGKWGVMHGQEMVEHLADFFMVSTGKINFALVTPVEHLPKYKEFLLSEKEFKENTKAPASVLGEKPLPLRSANMNEAVNKLQTEIDHFISHFNDEATKRTMHPAFGELDFQEWVQLHHKHVVHHFKQFGLIN